MRRGQSTVEYLLTMSVVSIAIVAIMLSFDAVFTDSVEDLSGSMADELGRARRERDTVSSSRDECDRIM